ncbi:MAG: response regulator [Gammaproteobacteria bacterium]|nr:response regulator [Gammaproteobacteria bacterium]
MADKPVIVLADDSRVIRKTILKMLGDRFEIIEAENGVSAWNQLKFNSRVELLVTDIDMPEMDGYSLICKIRADNDEGMQNLPVICITGAEDDITRENAYACGANDFILKPIGKEQLLNTIVDHLEEYEEREPEPVRAAVSEMPDLETTLMILRSPNPGRIDAHILNIILRVMPVLDYVNRRFRLGLDREILTIKRRILQAR